MRIKTTLATTALLIATSLAVGPSAPSSAAATPRCNAGSLAMTIGPSNGTAGTVYFPLVFTNVSPHSCTLQGIPIVHAATAINSMGGPLLGPPARKVNTKVKSYGRPVVIAPHLAASAAFGIIDTGALAPSRCDAQNAQSISVSLQGRMYWARLKFKVCAKLSSTTISGVVPGTTGIA